MAQTAYILAGEPSGDKLAASIMRSQISRYQFHGIGGPEMSALGLVSHHSYDALQIIGLVDALKSYHTLKKLLNQLVDEVCALRPQVIFTVDAKAFSLRFARAVKARMAQEGWQAPFIHMVAPTIWAYGAGRAKAFVEAFDAMLCLFPMESDAFDKSRIKTEFVGHPAAYEPAIERRTDPKTPVKLLLLPGSRRSEVTSLLPDFLTASAYLGTHRDVEITVISIDKMLPVIEMITKNSFVPVTIKTGQKALQDAFASHDMMLAASGTVTLEAALAAMPGLVAYRLNPLVAQIMTWRFLQKDPVLPNIIRGQTVYPFHFQKQSYGLPLGQGLAKLLQDEARDKTAAHHADALFSCLKGRGRTFDEAVSIALEALDLL